MRWPLIDGTASLHGTDLRGAPLDRLLNVVQAWVMERLERGGGDDAQQRLDQFVRLMEGDPFAYGDASRAEGWEARPEVQAAQESMMSLAAMAPPYDPRNGEARLTD